MEFYTLNKAYLRNLLVSYTREITVFANNESECLTKPHHLVLELDISAGLRGMFNRSVMTGYMNQGWPWALWKSV